MLFPEHHAEKVVCSCTVGLEVSQNSEYVYYILGYNPIHCGSQIQLFGQSGVPCSRRGKKFGEFSETFVFISVHNITDDNNLHC